MTISIKLPEGKKASCGWGTKIFNDKGDEIKNITSIDVSIRPDEVITATVEVSVNGLGEMDNVHAMLGTKTLQQIASLHGYNLVSKSVLGSQSTAKKEKG